MSPNQTDSLIFKKIEEFFDLFFPPCCTLCRSIGTEAVCPECLAWFKPFNPLICNICGMPLKEADKSYCNYCSENPPPFSSCRSVLIYEGKAREAILKMKFNNKNKIIPILASFLAEHILENKKLYEGRVLVPVPGAEGKSRLDTAAAFCDWLNEKFGFKTMKILDKTRKIKPQYSLSVKERRQNVKDAFIVRDGISLKETAILLIDDIYTSGATVYNCTKALVAAGAQDVKVLTLARTVSE